MESEAVKFVAVGAVATLAMLGVAGWLIWAVFVHDFQVARRENVALPDGAIVYLVCAAGFMGAAGLFASATLWNLGQPVDPLLIGLVVAGVALLILVLAAMLVSILFLDKDRQNF